MWFSRHTNVIPAEAGPPHVRRARPPEVWIPAIARMTTKGFCVLSFAFPFLAGAVPVTLSTVTVVTPTPIAVSTPTPVQVSTPAWITVVHPLDGARLPPIKEVFVFGAVLPHSTLMIN